MKTWNEFMDGTTTHTEEEDMLLVAIAGLTGKPEYADKHPSEVYDDIARRANDIRERMMDRINPIRVSVTSRTFRS